MEQTRQDRFKEYRSKMISEGAPSIDSSRKRESNTLLTTSALPNSEIANALERDEIKNEALLKLEKKRLILRYSLIGVFLLILIAGIIIFAIYAFK